MKRHLGACLVGVALVASPAAACPGGFAEKYLFWSALPDLAAGETAIEVDVKQALIDPVDTQTDGRRVYQIKRVIAGKLNTPAILVDQEGSTCSHQNPAPIGGKVVIDRLILIGRLEYSAATGFILIPRYMSDEESKRFGAGASDDQ